VLGRLSERRLVERLGRRPGQREERYRQLLGAVGDEEEEAAPAAPPAVPASDQPQAAAPPAALAAPPPPAHALDERVERLEREVAELRAGLSSLRDELGA
jgi:uncharacterized protein